MNPVLPAIAIIATLLSACSVLHGDDEPTIASLGKRPVKLVDTPVSSTEMQAISAYRSFLDSGDESDARPHAMRRIADLNLEKEELPQAGQATPDTLQLQPIEAHESIELYQSVLSLYPQRADNDSVLYQLARAYEMDGQPLQSLDTLASLVQQYPQSQYVLEAQFRRGEILFEQRDYDNAAQSYRAVVNSDVDNPFYQQSLYKRGWCLFKLSELDESLDAFMALLDLELQDTEAGIAQLDQLSRARRELVDDTLRVVSLSFSYGQGADGVAEYFKQRGTRHYEYIIYDNLGLLYLQKERYNDAAQTFQAFVTQNPIHRLAPGFQMRVIETYQQGKFPTLVLESKEALVDQYNLQSEYWQHYSPEDNPQVLDYLKLAMTDLSRHYHALAQKDKKPQDYQQAAHWYRRYLGSFREDKDAPQMNFLLAELLFESGDYQQAAREYEITAYDYTPHKNAAAAGYAAVLAYDKQEQRLTGSAQRAWHQQSIEHAIRFASTFPQHPQAMAVLTRSSEQLLASGDQERAIQVAQTVIASEQATAAQQRVAWTVQAHAYFEQGDFLQAEAAYQQVRQRMPRNNREYDNINERLAASIYKQGEAAQAAGETADAVAHFQRVREATPTASIVATAEYDAAAGLLSLQQWSQAAAMLDRFRNSYPNDPRQDEVTRRLATAYLAEKQPLQAAREFERIGYSHEDPTLRREALWQAAELYTTARQPKEAVMMYQHYIQQFPQPVEQAVEARQRIATHYAASNNLAELQRWLTDIIQADRQAGAQRSDRTRYLAAHAQLTLADHAHENYRHIRLVLPLKKSLATKKRLMQSAMQQYEQAAAYQVAEVTTAATFHTAQIYTELGVALLESQRPANLSGEPLEQYNILLEEQAYPFEEQAITLHETNVQRIASGLYNAWIEKSLQQLAQLVPAQYAKLERGAPYVTALQ
ncbi:MAG: tetratricopeptide repeat protein [Gammaproteobacteria bacterium]|jgi:tetratricopeptide (TPR) repeat protein